MAVVLFVVLIWEGRGDRKGKEQTVVEKEKQFLFPAGIVLFVIIILWCAACGLGGFVIQSSDWHKHNAILYDLVHDRWPVRYAWMGRDGVLCYYLAYYLVPAAIGKLLGTDAAELSMLVISAAGVWIACKLISSQILAEKDASFGKWKRAFLPFLVFGCVILFNTFLTPLSGIYRTIRPEDVGDGEQWLSVSIPLQYRPQLSALRWVPNQFVPTLITVALLFREEKRTEKWGLIIAPLIMYSTFAFVGTVMIAVVYMLSEMTGLVQRGEKPWGVLRRTISPGNAVAALLVLLFGTYLAGNVLQYRPQGAGHSFHLIDYTGHKAVFVLFQLAWLFWLMLLWHKEKRNRFLLSASVLLLILPFFTYGKWNDLCMDTAIPAMIVFSIVVVRVMIDSMSDRFYLLLLVLCLLFCSIGAFQRDIRNYCIEGGVAVPPGNHRADASSLSEFFLWAPEYPYQYICWEPDGVLGLVIRK